MSKRIIPLIVCMTMYLGHYAHAGVKECDKDGLDCKLPRFDFGLTGLYLQAYSTAYPLNKVEIYNKNINLSKTSPWNEGGILDVRYHYSERGDVNLNWMYYSVRFSATDYTKTPELAYSGHIRLNAMNAELAQSFNISQRSTVRALAGIQYLNVQNNNNDSDGYGAFTGNSYVGAGPRAGFDTNYKLKHNFSVFANGAGAIILVQNTVNAYSDYSSSKGKVGQSIPEFEAKLGLTYAKPLAKGTASLNAGWMVINYFNLLHNTIPTRAVVNRSTNDLALSGPFVQAKWVG